MPVNDRIVAIESEIADWRRTLHRSPELLYDLPTTAAFVAEKLESFGCDRVETGIAKTGVVGLIHGRSGEGGRMVGLRADMDALPIVEATGAVHASQTEGVMHACGHDGHTAMLLGAARHLCETRSFDGSVAVIFQPAEEGGAGGRAMIEDGLFERFNCERVFGLHNLPGLEVGRFGICPGPIMASVDIFTITVSGKGGHAAMPHGTVDPVVAASAVVQALQSVVSRGTDPRQSVVVSITMIHGGSADNVIPDEVVLSGTVRALDEGARASAQEAIGRLAANTAAAYGARAGVDYEQLYPVTRNDADAAAFCAGVATEVAGGDRVDASAPPLLAGEDFAFMLEAIPGAYIFLGNGDSAGLHSANYDFDDGAIVHGTSYWIALAERALGRNADLSVT